MIRNSEASEQAVAEPIVPDEITGLSRARHLPKWVRQ